MTQETLDAPAALATIGSFLLEVSKTLCRICKGRKTRRKEQKEGCKASENK